ncbi:MAG TPA: triose-phosphate isomerase [Candidatus Paceibacterota bacterium]|nr:triose-phosphate isomerase [Candidatus Paceibacterota bacterium]
MRKLIVANWKENPATATAARALFDAVARAGTDRRRADVVICPPFVYLEELAGAYRKMRAGAKRHLALGAQDVFWEERGAFTSEVGPKMIRSLGAEYVIVGHSERRKYLHETDAMVNKKIKLALRDDMRVILCVGEPPAVRRKGVTASKKFVAGQLKKDLAGLRLQSPISKLPALTIAYEPIWAIGTGRNDRPEDALKMAGFVKKILAPGGRSAPRFLYGGSVNSGNVGDYVQYKEVDGALVGGASLKAAEFGKMLAAVNKL